MTVKAPLEAPKKFASGTTMSNARKMIEVGQVTVSFDGFKALNDLNFSMNEGELRFVIGPNGAGKPPYSM